jgi:murein L,D-transpeptidase YafK
MKNILTLCLLLLVLAVIPAPARAREPRSPKAILTRIDQIYGPELSTWTKTKGIQYPPEVVLLRAFKQEKELEIWAKNAGQAQMQLIRTLPLCALDADPGPKLRQGDHKTPEGFYFPRFLYASRNWFMWIKLDQGKVVDDGDVDKGSVFNMYLPYPNQIDRQRTRAAGFSNTGGSICAHGNCVSDGCLSMKNEDFVYSYAFARHHDPKYGKLQYHVFPYRFGSKDPLAQTKHFVHLERLGKERLLRFWENLRQGYERFNATRNPLKFRFASTVLRVGDIGPDVVRVKMALIQTGHFKGEITPEFTPELKTAVKAFQKSKRIGRDGVVGPGTLRRMGFTWPKRYVFE